MDLTPINFIASRAYSYKNYFEDLIIDKLYQVIKISRRKTLWGSVIELTLEDGNEIYIPSFRYQNLFEQKIELYRSLKAKVDECNIFILYLGNKKIEFIYI